MLDSLLQVKVEDGDYRISGRETFDSRDAASENATAEGPTGPKENLVSWTWTGQEVIARSDAYGLTPLYYCAGQNEIVLGTSLLGPLSRGVSADLDEAAIAAFLRLQFYLGDSTPFSAIKRLPPNATLTWSRSGLAITGERPTAKLQDLSENQALDAYVEAFRQSIRKHPNTDDLIHPLSGGKDSRHILFELLTAKRRPNFCVTTRSFPPVSGEDCKVATQLSKALGLEQQIVTQRQTSVEAEVSKNLLTDFCCLEHGWFMRLGQFFASTKATIYDGFAGDILSAAAQQTPEARALYRAGNYGELADSLLTRIGSRQGSESVFTKLYAPRLGQDAGYEAAREALKTELARHSDVSNPLGVFYFWNRGRRLIAMAPLRVFPSHLNVIFPFLDQEVFELLVSLPVAITGNPSFHTKAILKAFPKSAQVPFADNRLTLEGSEGFARRAAQDIRLYIQRGPSELVDRTVFTAWLSQIAERDDLRGLLKVGAYKALYLAQLEEAIRDPQKAFQAQLAIEKSRSWTGGESGDGRAD